MDEPSYKDEQSETMGLQCRERLQVLKQQYVVGEMMIELKNLWSLFGLFVIVGFGPIWARPQDSALSDSHPPSEVAKTEIEKWEPLFNGRDLEGWTPKITGYPLGENFGDTFRVADGILQVRYDAYDEFGGRFGHLFYRESLSHYRLRFEYRFVGEQVPGGPQWAWRNSGIMLHGQTPESMELGQDFPVSIEAQLLGAGPTGERPTLNVCTPGTHIVLNGRLTKTHCINSQSPSFRGDQWVRAEIEVRGDRLIRHWVNGEMVLEYTQPQLDPDDATADRLIVDGQVQLSSGTISLQSESHPIDFRVIELLRLDEDR
ncbi:MAG TPA: DUF1080 domain-containing protein [Pirellulaceae bacterium]|nr:DUF1080 domain-containing protein [Pirellulaceae bacterium]